MDSTIDEGDYAVNLKLFERCGFYHVMFNSKNSTVAGLNVYRLSFIIFLAIVHSLIIFGNMGFVIQKADTPGFADILLIAYCNMHSYHVLIKLFVLMYSVQQMQVVFDVARFDFMKSNLYRKHIQELHKHREKSIIISNLYCIFCIVLIVQWILFPLVILAFVTYDQERERLTNIVNLPYPVTVTTYNQYYYLFYLFEMLMSVFDMYGLLLADMYVIIYGWVISTQYRILGMALEDIGTEIKLRAGADDLKDNYNEFKSTLHDLVRLDLKVKAYFSIVKPMVFIHVAVNSFLFIVLTFSLMVICMVSETIPVLSAFKVTSTVVYLCFQLSLYCYLFDNMNDKREAITFAMYSCNWTMMDLKFKKLLLLAMRMTDANGLILRYSPQKIIDIQLFADVMVTSHNVVSIMVKLVQTMGENAHAVE